MKIGVIGTGYIGLTTGAVFAYLGHEVVCQDIDSTKIQGLARGECPIFEPFLPELLSACRSKIHFTTNYSEAVSRSEVVFIAVGTPSLPDGSPQLDQLREAAVQIGANLGPDFTIVVNKSTVPVGSGNWVASILRQSTHSKLGKSSQVAFSVVSNPEFLREGSALSDTFYPDRIVLGAEDERSIEVLRGLYAPVLSQTFEPPNFLPRPMGCKQVPLVTAEVSSAELIKYAANAFLALKISFINEMARLSERIGADIADVAAALGLDKRIGSGFLQAGLGWGGSCFGKDTAALLATAREYRLELCTVQAAREVNAAQREMVLERLAADLKILKGRTIGLLGLAFKPNTDDVRDAPALDIARKLIVRGVRVKAHDPVAIESARASCPDIEIEYCSSVEALVADCEALVLVTEWPEYRDLPWARLASLAKNPLLLDGRNFLDRQALEAVGFQYRGVGR